MTGVLQNQCLIKLGKTFVALFLLFTFNLNAEEPCYQVFLKEPVDLEKCGPVAVSISKLSCGDSFEILKNYKDRLALVECRVNPKVLKTPFDGGYLISQFKNVPMWGKNNLILENTQFRTVEEFEKWVKP